MTQTFLSWKNFFCSKNWGNGPKIGFFYNLKKNLCINFYVTISPEQLMKQPHFLHVVTSPQKLNLIKNFGWVLSKMDVTNLASGL